MTDPMRSPEFKELVDELDQLLSQRSRTNDRRVILDLAARRFEVEQRLIQLVSPGRTDERRRHVRVPCRFPARARRGATEREAMVSDVGFGGMCVETSLPVGAKAVVDLEVASVPEVRALGNGLRCRGTVAWARPAAFGLELIAGDVGVEHRILQLVLELLRRGAGG